VHAVFSSLSFCYQYQCNWLPEKIRPEMTYYVSSGTLNLTKLKLKLGLLKPSSQPNPDHNSKLMSSLTRFLSTFKCGKYPGRECPRQDAGNSPGIILYHTVVKVHNYKGRPINKLQNRIIVLIFKIWKIQNIGFVGNLIGHIYWTFCKDGAIIMTSRVHRTQSVSAVFCPFFYHLTTAKHHCKLRVPEKWMRSAMKPL